MNLRTAFGLLVLVAGLAACSSDGTSSQGSPDMAGASSRGDLATGTGGGGADLATGTGGDMTAGSTGTITGHVMYTGSKMGTLKFALYDQMPGPTTPPKYFMFPTVDNPTFPYAYTLEKVVPGAYYVVVILDVAPASPAIPGAEDVVGSSTSQVTVPAGGTGTIDVTLPAM